MTEEAIEARAREGRPAVMIDDVPFAFVGRPIAEITTLIDVGDYLETKLRGIQCHATQVGRHSPYTEEPEEVMASPWFRQEAYVLARSTVDWPEAVATDLFAGLRSSARRQNRRPPVSPPGHQL